MLSIVEESMKKILLWINVGVDDCTAERAILASNEHCLATLPVETYTDYVLSE